MLKLIDIQIIISRIVINDIFDNFNKKLENFMKSLIKKLQTRNQ